MELEIRTIPKNRSLRQWQKDILKVLVEDKQDIIMQMAIYNAVILALCQPYGSGSIE